MRIAFIADALDDQYAGIHIYTLEILNALAKLDTQNNYIAVRSKLGTALHPDIEQIILPVLSIPGYSAYRLLVKIPQALVKAKADIVIEPRHFGPFNLPKHIRRMTVIHDLTPILFPEMHQRFSRTLQRWFLPSILRRADHVITNSFYTQQDVEQYYPITKGKITAIQLGKDSIFKPTKNDLILKKYKIKKPYFLSVGTIEPRKNLSTLLSAFEVFKQQTNNNYQLVLTGKSGWKNADLMAAIEQSAFSEDIILTGYVAWEELPVLYSAAEVFIYPSLYEGFGLPVLEAMACGTVVLVSEVSSLPEVGGAAAHYFPPTSVDALCEKMIELSQNQDLRDRSAALSLAQAEKFSWERAARGMVELW